MAVLVIGGAGYIGSHMVKRLLEEGEPVVVLDDLSTGFAESVLGGELIAGDFGSEETTYEIFRNHDIDAVIHFASFSQVGESVLQPAKYYLNNVSNTLRLLNAMRECGVTKFVFSSTAAVYGEAGSEPITEDRPCLPINPYGRTKRMVEEALGDFSAACGLAFFSLRYFNAAGADPEARIGERHNPETHLIPLVLQAASGRRDAITVFGRDYPTPDGTCIRDYVHVEDLCDAHLLALNALRAGHRGGCFNLGNSRGFSVAEVVGVARQVTGRDIAVKDADRRAGDPPVLVADAGRVRSELGWRPKRADIGTIIEDAWRWETAQGTGPALK
jgi:UDP-glucose 4-epimerase